MVFNYHVRYVPDYHYRGSQFPHLSKKVMIAEARGIASIPDVLSSAEAAPLLCAGITTCNALRNAGLRGGDLVAVQGIGGLGHLGIQFARHMGFRTVAIGRGREKEKLARDLGAHVCQGFLLSGYSFDTTVSPLPPRFEFH